jgi:hypothetical protein
LKVQYSKCEALKLRPLKFQCPKLELLNIEFPKQLELLKLELPRFQVPNIKLPKPLKVAISPIKQC